MSEKPQTMRLSASVKPKSAAKPAMIDWRLLAFFLLFALEAPFIAFLFDPLAINDSDPLWLKVRFVMREFVPGLLFFAAAFALFAASRYRMLYRDLYEAAAGHQWRAALIANLALLAVLAGLTGELNMMAGAPPWAAFSLWVLGAVVLYALLFIAAAPFAYWRGFIAREWPALAVSVGASAFVTTAAVLSRQSWNALSEATFTVSAFILSLYESNVVSDPVERDLGAGDFLVNIAAACSGYEGIGLISAFLCIYLWVFRANLKFPNAYLLLPVGIAAIWLLNSVRIAVLISIGAHISPEIAVGGFHSQAGWMMFLCVTIGLMFISHKIPFFSRSRMPGGSQAAGLSPGHQQAEGLVQDASVQNAGALDASTLDADTLDAGTLAAALLAPFLAITAAGILIAAFTVTGHGLYGVKILAGAGALWFFRRVYEFSEWRGGMEAAALGALVGVLWIATDPGRSAVSDTALYVQALGPAALVLWLSVRVLGTVVIAPIAEELAFRGYLHRMLTAKKFDTAPPAQFSWLAFAGSSLLFGLVHERWLAGALAGAVFAVALYRSGRIGGAIIAHVTANALIAAWAIAAGQWSLL